MDREVSRWFVYIDGMLTMNGINLFDNPKRSRALKRILFPLCFTYVYGILILTIPNVTRLLYINILLKCLPVCVMMYVVVLKRKSIRGLIKEIYMSCSVQRRKKLNEKSKKAFSVWLALLVLKALLMGLYWYNLTSKRYLEIYLYQDRGVIEQVQWHHHLQTFAMAFLYWYNFVALDVSITIVVWFFQLCLSQGFLDSMADFVNFYQDSVESLRVTRLKFQELKERADKLFYLAIFFNFASIYLDTGIRLAFEKSARGWIDELTNWGFYGLKAIVLLAFILNLNRMYEREEEIERLVIAKVSRTFTHAASTDTKLEKLMYLVEVTQSPLRMLTGWNMFALKRSFLLAFLGSVIPFAVMISNLWDPLTAATTKGLQTGVLN